MGKQLVVGGGGGGEGGEGRGVGAGEEWARVTAEGWEGTHEMQMGNGRGTGSSSYSVIGEIWSRFTAGQLRCVSVVGYS